MKPMIGMIKSLTNELTTVVNAAPMTMPTARSNTLPRAMNSLNSFHMVSSFLSPGKLGCACAGGRAMLPAAACIIPEFGL